MPACVAYVCWLVPSLSTTSGASRRTGAYFGMFAAAVCVQVMCWVFGPAEKLPPGIFEATSTSGAGGHEALGFADACGRFKRVLAQVGVRTLILVVCCWCMCAGGHWGNPAGSEAAASSG